VLLQAAHGRLPGRLSGPAGWVQAGGGGADRPALQGSGGPVQRRRPGESHATPGFRGKPQGSGPGLVSSLRDAAVF